MRAFVLGGPRLEQRRFMDWNFVSSSKERIDLARAAWRAQEFPRIPGDDQDRALPREKAETMIDCETETPGEFPQILHVRRHVLRADVGEALGSHDAAPSPHDLFDSALAACKTLTAMVYARGHGIPLERVESHVERDDSNERTGVYVLRVRLAFHGPMTDEQRAKLHDVVGRCPIHKLMTTTDVQIETAPVTPVT